MTEEKTIWTSLSIKKNTRKRVKENKGIDETYDEFLNRAINNLKDQENEA